MIRGGYILKPRIIKESDISHAPPCVREIWDYLLREANSFDNTYKNFNIRRGQLFRTYSDIRDALSWNVGYRKVMYNESQTKKAMKALREAGRITTTKELGGVLITICNYDYYQNPKNYERTSEGTDESTTKEPSKNQGGPTITRKYKKEEEIKNNNTEFFEGFKKITGKDLRVFDGKAKKQLNARLNEGYSVDDILKATENCKNDPYHIENPKYLTLEFITRSDKLSKYLNTVKNESGIKINF